MLQKGENKIYALTHDKLSGVDREFIEVSRIAKVGEIIAYGAGAYYFPQGPFYVANKVFDDGKIILDEDPDHIVHPYEYTVMEPTDVIHFKGHRYKMVGHPAVVGDLIVTRNINDELGKTAKVIEVRDNGDIDTEELGVVLRSEYRVLDSLGSVNK
ncbi:MULTISPECIES: hypothetical protein [Bacillus subtilis group]|uniref:hypothetical protein n=1 Tax=Bacillus subtilis group TaxID=653685 RepID=UPI001ABE269A|nr:MULTISPECIES: hypothetical protein [Bacillus subtilis group]MCB4338874.1 hypothetical protein [Bacillus subtilis]MCL9628404.1 hypothetical protein [Bacillus subtilis]QTG87193.1 hypothetical protein J4048_21255 [Bacillus amyloliquefaciens]